MSSTNFIFLLKLQYLFFWKLFFYSFSCLLFQSFIKVLSVKFHKLSYLNYFIIHIPSFFYQSLQINQNWKTYTKSQRWFALNPTTMSLNCRQLKLISLKVPADVTFFGNGNGTLQMCNEKLNGNSSGNFFGKQRQTFKRQTNIFMAFYCRRRNLLRAPVLQGF